MIRSLFEIVKRFLLSPKTVIVLIFTAGVFCIIGSLVPQLADRPPQFFEAWKTSSPKTYYVIDLLQFNRVFTSVWFLVLVAFIALSLALSIFYQTKALLRSEKPMQRDVRKNSFKDYFALVSTKSQHATAGNMGRAIKEVFQNKGYSPYLVNEDDGYFIFGKNRIGRWGMVVFHTGMLIVIIAAIYGLAFQKKGFVQVSQTASFQGRDGDWLQKRLGVFAKNFNLGFRVYLNRFAPVYWEDGRVRELESGLATVDDRGESRESSLSLRGPAEFKGVKIYQSPYYGYTLSLVLERKGEMPVITHFLLDAPKRKGSPFMGRMDFPTTNYIMDMKFYPDPFPSVNLTVTEMGEVRFKGRVLLNQSVQIGDDTLTFAQIRHWTGLYFTKNYGMPLVYLGFSLSSLGAIMIFMLSYKEMHVKVAEEEGCIRVFMGGMAKTYQAIFSEEMGEVAEELRKVLEKYGNNAIA